MAMAVDTRQQMTGLPYEQMRYQAPQFTNPWVSGPAASHLYATSLPQSAVSGDQNRPIMSAQNAQVSMPYQSSNLPALSMPTGTDSLDPMFASSGLQGQDYAPRPYGAAYPTTTATSGSTFTAPTSAPQQYTGDYKVAPYGYTSDRRSSHPLVNSNAMLSEQIEAQKQRQSSLVDFTRLNSASEAERNSFSDALDASRGMVAMSQDITPRNIYGNQGSSRSSTDAYGFPSHSSHSSISSASTGYPTYYNSSVSESSYGDYSSANESVDIPSRTLPRPNGLIGANLPPAPQSMMGQFSSKVSSSSQKKHKCKICDKRFTRPSSLQTHMYSHTGEKPFSCDVDGCGRHFSVVSNLRRHRKVHKGESDHPSPDDE